MSDYFVAPKLQDKKAKQYKKKIIQLRKKNNNSLNSLSNDDLDDELFDYSNLNYPINSIPIDVYDQIPNDQLKNLPSINKNPIIRNKYSTSVDTRSFFTTFEYLINGQSIIWDYNTGYVHFTGIWKALGHSKADILNLLDNAPELESNLKRVRGGFLKIQGSWLDFENSYKLACKNCWKIRHSLIPIFGINFLNDVYKPTDFGYGELKINSYLPGDPNDKTNENKKKRKKNNLKLKQQKKRRLSDDDDENINNKQRKFTPIGSINSPSPTLQTPPSSSTCFKIIPNHQNNNSPINNQELSEIMAASKSLCELKQNFNQSSRNEFAIASSSEDEDDYDENYSYKPPQIYLPSNGLVSNHQPYYYSNKKNLGLTHLLNAVEISNNNFPLISPPPSRWGNNSTTNTNTDTDKILQMKNKMDIKGLIS